MAQADMVIVARVTGRKTKMIVLADTDYAVYIGNECTCVKSSNSKVWLRVSNYVPYD